MLSGDSLKTKIVEIETQLSEKIKEKALQLNLADARYRSIGSATKSLEKMQSFLDPREKDDSRNDTQYFRRVVQYVQSLTGNLSQANFEAIFADQPVEDEIDTLFKTPKNVAEYWVSEPHFGIKWKDKYYNFDNALRLLFKINFLKAAALKEELSLEWKNQQLATLQQHVTDFANDQGLNCFSVEEIDPEELYRLQPDDTLDRENFFGYAFINPGTMWPAYWDAFWPLDPGDLRQDPSLFPLQMQHAHVYPWYERALYLLVGADVRKYFKDQWRVFTIGLSVFKELISDYYNNDNESYPLLSIAVLAWALIVMLFCDFPTALVKGILGLPFRALRALINSICDEGSFAWQESLDAVNKFETLLLFVLFLAVRIPLAIFTAVGGFSASTLPAIAIGIVAAFAKYIVKPMIECFAPNVEEPVIALAPENLEAAPAPAPSNTMRLMQQLARAQRRLGEQNDQLIIGDHVLSKKEIVDSTNLLRQGKPVRHLDWLLEVNDFSNASTARLFSLPFLAPVDRTVHADDVAAPANNGPY